MGGCDDDVRKLIIVSPPEPPPPSSRARARFLSHYFSSTSFLQQRGLKAFLY